MKTFFKDYGELLKQTGYFYKKHWLGTIIMNVVAGGVTVLMYTPKATKKAVVDNIRNKFKKESKVES